MRPRQRSRKFGATTAVAAALTFAGIGASPAGAASVIGAANIGFERDGGEKEVPQGFSSVDNPTVHFHTDDEATLKLDDFEDQSNGMAIFAKGDTTGSLLMRFDVELRALTLSFGNDDMEFTNPGDDAVLTVFRNGTQVGRSKVDINSNDAMDQKISFSGLQFDMVTFRYEDNGGQGLEIGEIIDDIRTKAVCTISGGQGDNRLEGTNQADGVCAGGGNDRSNGRRGNDVMRGDTGNDTLTGGLGGDLLNGAAGDDILRSNDGVNGNDVIYAGLGNDTCHIDDGDATSGCETTVLTA